MKTTSEIIDETVAHIKKHGRSIDDNGFCVYRSPDGNKCAVGRCMLDDKYREKFENKRASGIEGKFVFNLDSLLKPEYQGHSIEFWDYLQSLHDSPEYWNGNNLTPTGQEEVDRLKEMFSR